MRIFDGKTYRDATAAEIAEMQRVSQPAPAELTTERKLELMLASIPTEPTPTLEPKLGYKWVPTYTPSSGFAWELAEDPTALGTAKNPRYWVSGLAVKLGHYYTVDGKTLYIALGDGVPNAWADDAWFMEATA